MRKACFTEYQIIAMIKSVEAGRTVKNVWREIGISEATYYNWESKYGSMETYDIKKIKDAEDGKQSLKKMFADLNLENRALKDVTEKALKPAFKRELAMHLAITFRFSIRPACRALSAIRFSRVIPDFAAARTLMEP